MKKYSLLGTGLVIAGLLIWLFVPSTEENEILYAEVLKGDIKIEVSTTGELEAKSSVDILGPSTGLRKAGIWQININDLIPEGTQVKKGDYVAQLDASSLEDKIKNSEDNLTKEESQYTQVKLDTTLQLREARDKLINLGFSVEEKRIKLEQSAFEPPATIKQAKMDVIKAERDLKQAKANYDVKKEQMIAKMQAATAKLEMAKRKVQIYDEVKNQLTITAPEDGMVIYIKNWNGKKIKSGDQIGTWNPRVATLPDMSQMVSRTYVNEVDIRKIEIGQTVSIGLDAFPDKALTGEVQSVANIGEQKPNTDSKVYEVLVLINEVDEILRPAMTTSNVILTKEVKDCLYIPLESLHSQGDSITYVILKDGFSYTKQEVVVGDANDQYIIIEAGVEEGSNVALSKINGIEETALSTL
ncbi:efflux RND transporter periplasmic adaptor subunit [Sediminitomix flava]|uniref:Multidrug efflux pump subunit AcrA (Membrane-fusion protein) n=1 Tax=Sediminitomix flava TaxID=379075 RepID=A0A315Z8W6_SEDFL|nr:efflux RND transporter periplasmic adaptor subunit [Sediminitomix flava]PWJ41830.1 multidrug efflux pump subunit AcrA (membrane-fusion protein) [Sediminitomix flava]